MKDLINLTASDFVVEEGTWSEADHLVIYEMAEDETAVLWIGSANLVFYYDRLILEEGDPFIAVYEDGYIPMLKCRVSYGGSIFNLRVGDRSREWTPTAIVESLISETNALIDTL